MAFKFEKLMPKLRKEEKKESPAEEPKEKKPKEEPQGDEERSRKEYQEIKELKKKIDSLLEKPSEENIKEIEEMQEEAGKRIYQLREKFWPFENLPQKELKEQYENQKEILERVGILEKLSTGEIGIKGIDNKEYAFPEYQEIARRIRENKEILKPKTEQGFNQLLITPFGMKIDDLIKRYKQIILKHHREGKLLATKERPTDPDKPLELDENQPVWVWDKYNNADINGELVYFPKEFSKENHKGKTKQEIIKERGGFSVMFIEDLANIPRQGKGKEIKGRRQLEAGQTPNKYLEILKTNPIYQNETGMTPEEQIIYAISNLEQTNQVIDDYFGKGSVSCQLGAFFPASGDVPGADWRRGLRRAGLGGYDPKFSVSDRGVRAGVRV